MDTAFSCFVLDVQFWLERYFITDWNITDIQDAPKHHLKLFARNVQIVWDFFAFSLSLHKIYQEGKVPSKRLFEIHFLKRIPPWPRGSYIFFLKAFPSKLIECVRIKHAGDFFCCPPSSRAAMKRLQSRDNSLLLEKELFQSVIVLSTYTLSLPCHGTAVPLLFCPVQ